MLPNFITLIISTITICAIILFLSLYGYILGGIFSEGGLPPEGEFWKMFFSNIGIIPGISIAGITGAVGVFFRCLFEILEIKNQNNLNEGSSKNQPASYIIKPMIGSISAIILFIIIASGILQIGFDFGQSKSNINSAEDARIGHLFWLMRPKTILDLTKLILYSFIGGFFYPLIPNLLDKFGKNIFTK